MQRKQMTGWSSKGRRKVADLLGTCRKCSQTVCSSEQTLLEGEAGERKGFPHSSRDPLLLQKSETPTRISTFAPHGKGAAISSILLLASIFMSPTNISSGKLE